MYNKILIFVALLILGYFGLVLYANRYAGHRSLVAMDGSGTVALGEIEMNMKWDLWPIERYGYNVRIIAIGEAEIIKSTYSGHANPLSANEQYEMRGDLGKMVVGKSIYYIPHATEYTAIIPNINSKDKRDIECLRLK